MKNPIFVVINYYENLYMNKLPKNVWLLTLAQALVMSVNSVVVLVGGLVGMQLAPEEKLSTLPVATLVIGTALVVVPVTFLMKKIGRRKSFILILLFSILVAFLASYAIHIASFYLFCASTFLFGATSACAMQFRFAAMESVTEDMIPNAASGVLLGGIAAAFIGPEVAVFGKDLFPTEFMGSFILLSGLFVIGIFILLGYKNVIVDDEHKETHQRSLKEIAMQPVFWVAVLSAAVGYAVMSFIMTATPVSMHIMDGHSLLDTKYVIQSHIVAMFLPSFIAAWIIKKLGTTRMMILGLCAYVLCIGIAYADHSLTNYWISLILLGVGWNFLFIGGTTLLPRSYHQQERFKVQALNEFVVFGTQAVASLSAGWFVFAMGWETLLLINLPFMLFLLMVILKWSMGKKKLIPEIK